MGFGGFQLFGTKIIGGNEKNCYIFTKGEAFCVLPGKYTNGAPKARHIDLNYNDGNLDPNDGLITDTPNDNSVFIDFDSITGTIQTIYKNQDGGTKGVVINYRPSFQWFLKQFINMIRRDFLLYVRAKTKTDLKYQNPTNTLFAFLNLLALPIAQRISERDNIEMIKAIEKAKFEMLQGTGLLLDDEGVVEGITPIFDKINDEIVPIQKTNKLPVTLEKDNYKLSAYHCENLFGFYERENGKTIVWSEVDSEDIMNNHQPLKILLENHQKLAPNTNWYKAMPNYKYIGIGQVFLKLLESRHNRILDYKISIELENLLAGEQSYGDVDDLIAEKLMFAQDVSYGRLGTLGDIIFAINPASDGYHTQKRLIHCMPGLHGIKKHRDYRKYYNWELEDDEWVWNLLENNAYLPVKGVFNIFALLERFFYSNEAIDNKAGYDPMELLLNIYSDDPIDYLGLLPNPYVTRFPTKALIDDNIQTVTTHVNLATQSGIRLLLSFFMKLTYMTQNVVNKEFKSWLDLLDCMNAFGSLYSLLNDDVPFEGIRYTDTDWQEFADSTKQKEDQKGKYSPKEETIYMPFLDLTTSQKIWAVYSTFLERTFQCLI